ncbi:MAG TPA: hypothetical protein VEB43_14545 [Anaeromyxobacter sp.]|nr:hypothetical protein [Anaeromyxobacter sp.]
MRNVRYAAALLLAVMSLAARAEEGWYENVTPGHSGFFFHAELGGSWLAPKAADQDRDLSFVGASSALGFGWSVSEEVVLGQEVWSSVGVDVEDTGAGRFVLIATGPMLRGYLDPGRANWFYSVTPSLTRLVVTSADGSSTNSKFGGGVRVAIGKEWLRPPSRWGIGVAAQFGYSSNRMSNGSDQTVSILTTGLNLSLTMN